MDGPLRNIYFAPGSADVSDSDSMIIQLTDLLREKPNLILEVRGHSDTIECAPNDSSLSRQRAIAVYELLKKNGIPSNRIALHAYAGTKPVSPCKVIGETNTDPGCAMNRRVTFAIVGTACDLKLNLDEEEQKIR